MSLKTIFSFGSDLWDPSNRFETSWFLSPWALFACRALIVRSSSHRKSQRKC